MVKTNACRIFCLALPSIIECDILVSGELDFDASLLSKLDMVIISVHQLLRMDEQKATNRLIKAIENPYTTILGHMTGRQLLTRPGYPVDFKKVIDACAANGVIIEVNANPYRLDVDWEIYFSWAICFPELAARKISILIEKIYSKE